MAPLALPGALLFGLAVHPKVILARVLDETAHGRRAVDELHRALGYLRRRAAIDESTLRRLARPLAANVARQDLDGMRIFFVRETHIVSHMPFTVILLYM